jgi:hypothetical protein
MASGNAEELVSAFPGAAVHELPGLVVPSGDAGVTVPVALPPIAPRIMTGIAGGKVSGWLVLEVIGVRLDVMTLVPGMVDAPTELIAADGVAEELVVAVTLITEGETTTAVGEQLKLVPGMVGSVASGGEAKVVAGAPGIVDGEKRLTNGPGPPSGDETMAPGVVGMANCVVPIVDICARQAPLVSSRVTPMYSSPRMLFSSTTDTDGHEFAGPGSACGVTLAPSARSTTGLRMT